MKFLSRLLLFVVTVLLGASATRATTLTFEDVVTTGSDVSATLGSYAGFTWSNVYVLDGLTYYLNPSGYQTGIVSGSNVAYNAYGDPCSFASPTPFTLTSAYFTSAWYNGNTVTISASRNGSTVDSTSFVTNTSGPVFETFNWTGIDTVSISTSDLHVAIDNITVNGNASSNANLSNLTLSSGTLNPVFTSSGTSYTATVANSVTSETVTPTVSDTTATVVVAGGSPLAVGANTITATVTAQDRTTKKVYAVVVTRLPSSNANLANLLLSSGTLSPVFTTSGTSYTATVANSVTSETVTATVADATATVAGAGVNALIPGPNTIAVTVTAQDGTTSKQYVVVVTRQEDHARYYFSNFVGSPGAPYGWNDGVGSAAGFSLPYGVALTASGTLYVTDYINGEIRRVSPAGAVTTFASGFNFPQGIALDASGNVYVADTYNYVIRKVTSGGVVTTLAGALGLSGSADGIGSAARFFAPSGVAVDASGNIYVADNGNSTIRKVTPSGAVATLAGSPGMSGTSDGIGSAARFCFPYGIAIDASGNLYVADGSGNAIRKVTPGGVVTTLAGNFHSGSVDGVGTAARFHDPFGIAVDANGNVYVADTANHTIRELAADGSVTTLGGSPGTSGSSDGFGSDARFFNPSGVAVDANGNLYVADLDNNRISKGVPMQVTGGATVVNGTVSFTGMANPGGQFSAVWFDYGLDRNYGEYAEPQGIGSGSSFVTVSGTASGLVNNATYHYRLGFTCGSGTFYGSDSTFTNAPSYTVNRAAVSSTAVTLSASVNPCGFAGPKTNRTNVLVSWQYGLVAGTYPQVAAAQAIGTGTVAVPLTFTRAIKGLKASVYHYRLVISSTVGTTYGPDQTFSVKPPVVTYGAPATTGSGATVSIAVDPSGLDTTVSIQYGLTTAYTSGTVAGQDVGDGLSIPVSGAFTGLVPNTLYHYRVVTTNALGTVYGADQVLATQPMYGTAAVASIKDAATGIAGATFSALGNPAINDSDHVAFQATVTGGTASGVVSTNNSGIWAGVGANPRLLIARSGSAAPGYGGSGTVGTFGKLSDPVYSNSDAVAFVGTLASTGTVSAANNSGIWATGAGSLALVARTGDHAPDASGSTSASSPVFASFGQLVVADRGGVVFLGNLAVGIGGVAASNSQGIWAQGVAGTLKRLIRTGDTLTVGGTPKSVSALTVFNTPASATGQARHLNAFGNILCKVSFSDGSSGFAKAVYPFTTGLAMAVTSKDTVPGIAGAAFSPLSNPALNDYDHIAFKAGVTGGTATGITPSNNTGIWADSGTHGRLLAVRTGSAAPGFAGSGTNVGTFSALSDPVYANDDAVAFMGSLVTTGTVSATNNSGIWATVSGSLALVARAGDRAPDANGNLSASSPVFASFAQLVLPNQGGVVFQAKLVSGTGGVVTATDGGIWAQNASGVLKQLIRKGDGLTVNGKAKIVSTVSIFTAPANETGQTRHFNDAGDLLYKIGFSDGTSSIVQTVFP